MTKPAIAVRALGQSIWLDSIRREAVTSGELRQQIAEEGVSGLTSNPTIFEKAISSGDAYDEQLLALDDDLSTDAMFEALAAHDLRAAADLLRPLYDQTAAGDGFVSMEVSPELAYDAEQTLVDVRRLWALLDRPNVMIKIPGTRAGLPAIEQALYEGVNINITLLFAVERYREVIEAYLRALERRVAEGKPIDRIRSVASFFVSRVDTLVDKKLDEQLAAAVPDARARLESLRSTIAIANAKLAYQAFRETFAGPRWEALRAKGAALQRPLWASTSTKDPRLPDTYYVDALIGPHTVNTLPPQTLQAFNDHGTVGPTLETGLDEARARMERLAATGIDMAAVTAQLEVEGVRSFADSFRSLRQTIKEKRDRMLAARKGQPRHAVGAD